MILFKPLIWKEMRTMKNLILNLSEFVLTELIKYILVSNRLISDDYTFEIIFLVIRSIVSYL